MTFVTRLLFSTRYPNRNQNQESTRSNALAEMLLLSTRGEARPGYQAQMLHLRRYKTTLRWHGHSSKTKQSLAQANNGQNG